MKKIILIIQLIVFSVSIISAQYYKSKTEEKTDTIFRLGGKVLLVNVVQINQSEVDYMFKGDPKVYSIERKQVQKVVYTTGKVEEFNKPVFIEIDETSWEAVLITENKEEVDGLYKRGEISAKSSPGTRNKKSAKNSVMIRLQKKAANLKGAMVLITHKESRGGYGEIPGYFMKGDVYGFEPLEEEKEEDDLY